MPIARLARTVSDQALQAHDIFQSVVALGKPEALGLHHTECVHSPCYVEQLSGLINYSCRVWELAVAVKATSGLDNKDALGYKLKELGDWTRDVKDTLTSLNAKGINSFSWTLHEVRSPLPIF